MINLGNRLLYLLGNKYPFTTLSLDRGHKYGICDVTAAILVFQNKETAAKLVYHVIPPGIKLYFYAKILFFSKPIWPAGHVSENSLYQKVQRSSSKPFR